MVFLEVCNSVPDEERIHYTVEVHLTVMNFLFVINLKLWLA